jgi:hypothetical protein
MMGMDPSPTRCSVVVQELELQSRLSTQHSALSTFHHWIFICSTFTFDGRVRAKRLAGIGSLMRMLVNS